jgi:lipid-A-disaccharide synthase
MSSPAARPLRFMFIAGDLSGDALGGALIAALRERKSDASFFGAGGPAMQAAGLEAQFDFTRDGVFGLEALLKFREFKRRFDRLLALAVERQPDAIVCVDFGGFNRRFAHAAREHVRKNSAGGWNPKVIQYVSPQVWASRPGRADKMAEDLDLLLTIFPFEPAWYRQRTPKLAVEFVGHPIVERFAGQLPPEDKPFNTSSPRVLILPGSRPAELKRHLPIVRDAVARLREAHPSLEARVVLPERLVETARAIGLPEGTANSGDLQASLAWADVALAKSGTITLECAYFGVPTVVFYRAGALTYAVASRIVQVKWIAMPNLLANEEVFPEFVQAKATGENIAQAALELIGNAARRSKVQATLRSIRAGLGKPGASGRAAEKILQLLGQRS